MMKEKVQVVPKKCLFGIITVLASTLSCPHALVARIPEKPVGTSVGEVDGTMKISEKERTSTASATGNKHEERKSGTSTDGLRRAEPRPVVLGDPHDSNSYGDSPVFGSAWCNLDSATDFVAGDRLRFTLDGEARRVMVRLLPKDTSPDKPTGIVADAGFDVPAGKVIEVPLMKEYRNISQISVHGGPNPWGMYPLGRGNGPVKLRLVELIRNQ
jgi:hypothetical protein